MSVFSLLFVFVSFFFLGVGWVEQLEISGSTTANLLTVSLGYDVHSVLHELRGKEDQQFAFLRGLFVSSGKSMRVFPSSIFFLFCFLKIALFSPRSVDYWW